MSIYINSKSSHNGLTPCQLSVVYITVSYTIHVYSACSRKHHRIARWILTAAGNGTLSGESVAARARYCLYTYYATTCGMCGNDRSELTLTAMTSIKLTDGLNNKRTLR